MAHPILMPKPGQMTEECVLVAWHKREGDAVHRGDLLFEIETDKSNMDVEAFDDGVLLKRAVMDGDTVPVGTVCGYIGNAGEQVPEGAVAEPAAVAPSPDVAAPAAVAPAPVAPSPAVAAPRDVATAPAPVASGPVAADRLRISPRASRAAAELGVDPRAIVGTGPDGRIVERDVRAAAQAPAIPASPVVAAPLPTAPLPTVPLPADEATDAEAPRPLSRMRRVIAERLTLSATTVPQFTVTVSVDMTRLVALRQQLRGDGVSLTVTDFIAWSAAQTLVEFPDVNARTDGKVVWPRSRVNVGVAVSLPDGLVVPVIRDADRRSLRDIHARSVEIVEAARGGRLLPDDMTGGTFTISNLGMHGVDEFTAIINPGESAILAVSSIAATPVAVADGIAVRQVMKLTLTSDHRLVDGEMAARFLNALRRRLEDPDGFRADVLNG